MNNDLFLQSYDAFTKGCKGGQFTPMRGGLHPNLCTKEWDSNCKIIVTNLSVEGARKIYCASEYFRNNSSRILKICIIYKVSYRNIK